MEVKHCNKFDFKTLCSVESISYHTAQDYVIKNHYLHRKSPFKQAFGLFLLPTKKLVGVCIFGKSFSSQLNKMICGPEHQNEVIELTRLCIDGIMPKNSASYFVGQCLKRSELEAPIVVSFADTSQGHKGIIYQALNFIYTGPTRQIQEYKIEGLDKHNSSISKGKTVEQLKIEYGDRFKYVKRSVKYRYVYFRDKRLRSKLKLNNMAFPK